jgi:hypothetical protein
MHLMYHPIPQSRGIHIQSIAYDDPGVTLEPINTGQDELLYTDEWCEPACQNILVSSMYLDSPPRGRVKAVTTT